MRPRVPIFLLPVACHRPRRWGQGLAALRITPAGRLRNLRPSRQVGATRHLHIAAWHLIQYAGSAPCMHSASIPHHPLPKNERASESASSPTKAHGTIKLPISCQRSSHSVNGTFRITSPLQPDREDPHRPFQHVDNPLNPVHHSLSIAAPGLPAGRRHCQQASRFDLDHFGSSSETGSP